MNASRDPDRLIHAFLSEGEEVLQDQVYDAVRAAIEHKRQRVVIGPWRTPLMSRFITFGLGAAAVVVIGILLGSQLLGTPANVGGEPIATPEATATAEPTATPSPTATPEAFLPEGPFTIVDRGALFEAPSITVTIPASGWSSLPDFGGLIKGPDEDPPESAMLLWAWPVGTEFDVYGDPCQWQSTRPASPATTVEEIAAALAAQASRDASGPTDVTVGGYSGKKLTLHVPNDAPTRDEAFAECDDGEFASFGIAGDEPSRIHQGPGQVDELWILDVDGYVATIDVMYRPDTPAAVIDEMRAIAESATFELP
jgi:hypothetical protein